MHSNRPIAIVGFMGSGKTVVARILSADLKRQMVDLDELITERHRRTPAQIITEDSEPVFRTIETHSLKELLQSGFKGVIALGGGAWIELPTRTVLTEYNVLTIWLDVPFEICWRRIESSPEIRPLARTRNETKRLYDLRRETYSLAEVRLEGLGDESPQELASRVKLLVSAMLH